MLRFNGDLLVDADSHGLKQFGYTVEFSTPPAFASFGQPGGPWSQREAMLDRVEVGYGSQPFKAQFRMWDPDSVEAPHLTGTQRTNLLKRPRVGEIVLITVFTPEHQNGMVVFKGPIESVHERRHEGGIQWVCEAVSDVVRLNESHVTFEANKHQDPNNPTPVFDGETGFLLHAKLKTVVELVNMVLTFPDAYQNPQYWTPEWVNWNGFDESKRCGLFTPANINFEDAPKGRALETILQLAGNYTFLYLPRRDETDQIIIVELNLACNKCGDKWELPFPSLDRTQVGYRTPYAYENKIQNDSTEWSSDGTANVCRFTGGEIRFYSGHYIVPERLANYPADLNANARNILADGSKFNTIAKQQDRAINPDGAFFRFNFPHSLAIDRRTLRQWFVGMPLFPDWNVHEDYLPMLFQIGAVRPESTFRSGTTVNTYRGLVEFAYRTIGDVVARGAYISDYADHLRAWQAWYAVEECPACQGSGNVKKIYNNAENTPDIELLAVSNTGTRTLTGNTYTVGKHEKVVMRVTNYIFAPKKFGEIDPNTGEHWTHAGLQPFDSADNVASTGGYPVPWKNLCPYCRGVGLKPEYKIRNIRGDLATGKGLAKSSANTGNIEISLDPDQTQLGPESWEQMKSRELVRESYAIQCEMASDWPYPKYVNRNDAWPIQIEKNEQDKAVDINSLPFQKFPHPLAGFKKLLPQRWGLNDSASTSLLGNTNWHTKAFHTRLTMHADAAVEIDATMGRVLFQVPQFIPCFKQSAEYNQINDRTNTYIVTPSGPLQVNAGERDTEWSGRPNGYYRPPRMWMQFYYVRDRWYHLMDFDPDNNVMQPVDIEHVNEDGELATYRVKSMVIDGRYTIEVKKLNSNTDELDSFNRVIQVPLSDEGLIYETFEEDLWKFPVVNDPNATPEELDAQKKVLKLQFPNGKLSKFGQVSPGEKQAELEGWTDLDYFNNPYRFRLYTWRQRDQRPRQLSLAIKKLESSNNLRVNGSITMINVLQNMNRGLGWVDYPEKGRAAVKRVSLEFGGGFHSTIELSRERARVGELPPKDAEIQSQIVKDLTALKRAVFRDETTGTGSAPRPSSSTPQSSADEQGDDGSVVNEGRHQLFF